MDKKNLEHNISIDEPLLKQKSEDLATKLGIKNFSKKLSTCRKNIEDVLNGCSKINISYLK